MEARATRRSADRPEARAQMRELSIVIATWNQSMFLGACLASLQRELTTEVEVIVVDNGSVDATAVVLDAHRAGVARIIRNKTNKGVACARNQGIKEAQGELIWFLDDDTSVHRGAVNAIIQFMNAHPDVWVAGTKQLRPTGSLECNCRMFYSLPVVLARRLPFARPFISSHVVRQHLMDDWDHNDARTVDWVAGGSLVIRRRAIETVGAMDQSFFFGFEDTDYCLRVWNAGHAVAYVPGAIITHHVQGSSRKMWSRKQFQHLRSMLTFYGKHGWKHLFFPPHFGGAALP